MGHAIESTNPLEAEMLVTVEGEVAGPERELTRHDRCDRCGAQAYFQAIKHNWELLFCRHHGIQHEAALVLEDWVVLDSSHLLNQTM